MPELFYFMMLLVAKSVMWVVVEWREYRALVEW